MYRPDLKVYFPNLLCCLLFNYATIFEPRRDYYYFIFKSIVAVLPALHIFRWMFILSIYLKIMV